MNKSPPQAIKLQVSGIEDIEAGVDGRFRERFYHEIRFEILGKK